MIKRFFSLAIITLATASLTACASGARFEKMTVQSDPMLSAPAKFENQITLANITGGKETNPLLVSKVDNKAFTEALKSSLAENGYLSENENARYVLNAELLGLEQPMVGFSFTVDSIVSYELNDTKKTSPIFNETIKSAGKATMGDSPIGVERLRIANEYSVQNNIRAFLEALSKNEKPNS